MIRSGYCNGHYDGLFDHIVVAMEADVASPWDSQLESHNAGRMRGQAFELVELTEGFNYSPHLPLDDKHFRRNRAAIAMSGWLLPYWPEKQKDRKAAPPPTAGPRTQDHH